MNELRRRLHSDENGTTLMEVVVGMALLSVFMVIFTAAIYMMFNASNKVETVASTTNETADAFLLLDREVRYASAITTPSYDSGMWNVEFSTNVVTRSGTNAVATSTRCTQLAVMPPSGASGSVGELKQRTWTVGDTSPGAWNTVANNVTDYQSTDKPFPATTSIAGGNASTSLQQLTVNLVTARQIGSTSTSTASQFTFTALNSATPPTTPVCQQFAVGANS